MKLDSRMFDQRGSHVGGSPFPVSLGPDILFMRFFSSMENFVSVHWSGDEELDDTRIWINAHWGNKSYETVLVQSSVHILSFEKGYVLFTPNHSKHCLIM